MVKFLVYLNRLVFVMQLNGDLKLDHKTIANRTTMDGPQRSIARRQSYETNKILKFSIYAYIVCTLGIWTDILGQDQTPKNIISAFPDVLKLTCENYGKIMTTI